MAEQYERAVIVLVTGEAHYQAGIDIKLSDHSGGKIYVRDAIKQGEWIETDISVSAIKLHPLQVNRGDSHE